MPTSVEKQVSLDTMDTFRRCSGADHRIGRDTINNQLLHLQEVWLAAVDADRLAERYPLSRPFSFAVTEAYLQSDRRVMVIGQEAQNYAASAYLERCREQVKAGKPTDDFGGYNSDWSLPEIQNFNACYVDTQLGRPVPGYDYNRSPFWNLFRALARKGIEPIWNNVDKFHRFRSGKTLRLDLELEELLSVPYGPDRRSLLQREIELAEPDLILFVTGPHYHESMALACGVKDETLLSFRPYRDSCCQDVTELIGLGIPVLWSYHPAYLQRIRSLNQVVERVETLLNMGLHT